VGGHPFVVSPLLLGGLEHVLHRLFELFILAMEAEGPGRVEFVRLRDGVGVNSALQCEGRDGWPAPRRPLAAGAPGTSASPVRIMRGVVSARHMCSVGSAFGVSIGVGVACARLPSSDLSTAAGTVRVVASRKRLFTCSNSFIRAL